MSDSLIVERAPVPSLAGGAAPRPAAPAGRRLPHDGTLALRDLGCVRGDRPLFDAVSASAGPGTLLRVRGANGAGKTTLLRAICGLSTPAAGEVLWRGVGIAASRDTFAREHLHLGHAAALQDALSALENVEFATAIGGRPCTAAEALGALARSGLRGHEHLPVRLLSEGQRRRAALARLALADAPPLWVLDEPFNALDTFAAAWLRSLVVAHRQCGGVVVLTSHTPTPLDSGPGVVAIDL